MGNVFYTAEGADVWEGAYGDVWVCVAREAASCQIVVMPFLSCRLESAPSMTCQFDAAPALAAEFEAN